MGCAAVAHREDRARKDARIARKDAAVGVVELTRARRVPE